MTALVNLNQKMPSFIHFREVSGFRRVIKPFDSYFSQNIGEGGGFE
jgi:hypothetical protein